MLRLSSLLVLLGLAAASQAQIPGTGIPASVVSPTANGQQHGIPASVVSPKAPVPAGNRHFVSSTRRPLRPFGNPHHRAVLVPVPVFYSAYAPIYSDSADPATAEADAAEPAEDDSNSGGGQDALRQAYLQGARDALARKADRLSADSRAVTRPKPAPAKPENDADPVSTADNSPSAVFIFKDGHQIETRNFAIMGQTLYDFNGEGGLKKVQLSDLDTAATQRANDDRGVTVKLP